MIVDRHRWSCFSSKMEKKSRSFWAVRTRNVTFKSEHAWRSEEAVMLSPPNDEKCRFFFLAEKELKEIKELLILQSLTDWNCSAKLYGPGRHWENPSCLSLHRGPYDWLWCYSLVLRTGRRHSRFKFRRCCRAVTTIRGKMGWKPSKPDLISTLV